MERKQAVYLSFADCLPRDCIWFHLLYSQMDCKPRYDLSSKGHRKDGDKSRNRKDDDSLAEASHSKKTVKKAGNGEAPNSQFGNGGHLLKTMTYSLPW